MGHRQNIVKPDKDREIVMQIVEITQTVPDVASMRELVIPLLQERVGCESVYWGTSSTMLAQQLPVQTGDPKVRSKLDQYSQNPSRYDSKTTFLSSGALAVATDQELFTRKERDRLPLFTEVLRPAGIRTYLGCLIGFRGNASSFVAFSRHGKGPAYTDAERQFLRSTHGVLGIAEALLSSERQKLVTHDASVVPRNETSRNPRRTSASTALVLQHRYGLTAAEVALACQLAAEPLRLSETAELLAISLNTAKTHLQRVFAKTSTRRQSELLKLVLELGGG